MSGTFVPPEPRSQSGGTKSAYVGIRLLGQDAAEKARDCSDCVEAEGKVVSIISPYTANVERFQFSAVWNQDATNEDIYSKIGPRVVRNAFDGVNSCVLFYGSGADTHHSLFGERQHEAGSGRGFGARLVEEVFARGGAPTVTVTAYAFLGNDLVDTLAEADHGQHPGPLLQQAVQHPQIRGSPQKGQFLEGVEARPAASVFEAMALINRAAKAVSAVPAAARHSIVEVTVTCDGTMGRVQLVALGGERCPKDPANRDERQNAVNQSLVVLRGVLMACGKDKGKTVPQFRNSKITRVLQNSLAGNCHPFIVGCVRTADIQFDDSIVLLRHAESARRINVSVHPVPAPALAAASAAAAAAGTSARPTSARGLGSSRAAVLSANPANPSPRGRVHEPTSASGSARARSQSPRGGVSASNFAYAVGGGLTSSGSGAGAGAGGAARGDECIAEGLGLRAGVLHCASSFSIFSPSGRGGDRFSIGVFIDAVDGRKVVGEDPHVHDHRDGSYSVWYVPKVAGNYSVTITASDREPVAGSPFCFFIPDQPRPQPRPRSPARASSSASSSFASQDVDPSLSHLYGYSLKGPSAFLDASRAIFEGVRTGAGKAAGGSALYSSPTAARSASPTRSPAKPRNANSPTRSTSPAPQPPPPSHQQQQQQQQPPPPSANEIPSQVPGSQASSRNVSRTPSSQLSPRSVRPTPQAQTQAPPQAVPVEPATTGRYGLRSGPISGGSFGYGVQWAQRPNIPIQQFQPQPQPQQQQQQPQQHGFPPQFHHGPLFAQQPFFRR